MGKPKTETSQLVQRLKKAEENRAWLETHWEELVQSYQDQWIAVHNGRVIASDADQARLFAKLRRDYPDFQLNAVELITSAPLDVII